MPPIKRQGLGEVGVERELFPSGNMRYQEAEGVAQSTDGVEVMSHSGELTARRPRLGYLSPGQNDSPSFYRERRDGRSKKGRGYPPESRTGNEESDL